MKIVERLRQKILPKRYGSVEWKAWKKHYRETSLLKLAHSLEKGQGLSNTVPGRSREKANILLLKLQQAAIKKEIGFDFLVSLHTLNNYVTFQKENNIDVDVLSDEVKKLIDNLSEEHRKEYDSIKSGAYIYQCDKQYVPNVEQIFQVRHSVRDFDLCQNVSEEEILEAVRIASLAPSACNRQPWKVYYTLNRETAKKCVPFIPGIKGFEENVPYFAVITVDRSLFDLSEIYQWFVNGGIFLAYFVNALNGVGLGSCIFQFPFNEENRSDNIKKLIGAPENETVCAIVGFGKRKERYKAIYAQRRNSQDITKIF